MKLLKKSLSFLIVLTMLVAVLPTTALAAVDSTGKPTDLANDIVLSIYTPDGQFPGEPAVYGTSNYKSFKSDFTLASTSFLSSSVFKDDAESELKPSILDNLVEGSHSDTITVWGVYDPNGIKEYFRDDASITKEANEIKMIRAIKNISEEEAKKYEIVWYVIKLQHSSGWFGKTEWHIDGVIKEKSKISINYYGNGNTSGDAPLGETNHTAGDDYTVLGPNTMKKSIGGVEVAFLGWSAKSDGTGEEAGFYQPGDVINPTESISLYAMWDTTTQYTATVYTYLDGVLTKDTDIHGEDWDLHLSTDEIHYYQLNEVSAGVYNTRITGNGKFHLYNKEADGTYTPIGNNQLTIYNQDGYTEVYHFSVSYDPNGGTFTNAPEKHNYGYGKTVTAVTDIPTREGYRFLGWEDQNANIIQPGEVVTDSITEKTVLTAVWEKTVSVTINVTINHEGGGGYNTANTKEKVKVELVARENSTAPYLETGDVLTLSNTTYEGFTYSPVYAEGSDEVIKTQYISNGTTYENMPGGEVDYSVVASKSGYDTTITPVQDADGNWVIDVVMTYNPLDFDLEFTVTVDESVPEKYVPVGAIVKVACWSVEENDWVIITQHNGYVPGVNVTIDPATRKGSGSYPVWRYTPVTNDPYGYRLVVSSFIYPDGTIVRASDLVEDVSWTDGAYIATMDEVAGGRLFGTQNGAYFESGLDVQHGTLNANITIEIFDVIFDAKGGKVNGLDKQTVEDQLRIPAFADYVPTRDGGYIFDGWYLDEAYTTPAVEGTALSAPTTLYAKWIEPLTISGTVTVSGTYILDGKKVDVNDIDRAVEAEVILHEIHDGHLHEVDSMIVTFGSYDDLGSADYAFTGILNNGKSYQISVFVLNYTTTYDNESDEGTSYSDAEYIAIFNGDNVADVDAYLSFEAPAYDQILNVDATAISEGFRPSEVLSEVMYRDLGDNHPYTRISQHNVEPYGVEIGLTDGIGKGSFSVWQWHTDGQLYLYQMNVTNVDGTAYDSDIAPFYIVYDEPAYWDNNAGAQSNELKATLMPKIYAVNFDLNADGDTVTGMDAYLQEDGSYLTKHTWSYATPVSATPVRENYRFIGWEADVDGAYDGSEIGAEVCQNVTLTAKWEKITYTVTTVAAPEIGGTTTGDGTYDVASEVTVVATANDGYNFIGWYENDEKVSDDAEYTFTATGNHTLTAKFEKDIPAVITYTVTTNAQGNGTTTGDGTYVSGTEVTLTAQADEGYVFVGWRDEDDQLITADNEFKHTVTEDVTFTAYFEKASDYRNNYAYIFGYNDYEIGAEGQLLRSEVSVMVHRLVKQNNKLGDFVYDSSNPSFADIQGEWFQSGIEFMHHKGAFNVEEGGNVQPYVAVTRGEAFKIIALGLGFTTDTTLSNDEYANLMFKLGYIVGDESGDLNVGGTITRAEFCTIYNNIIGRENALLIDADGNEITAETYGFTDLSSDIWYYPIMLRATSAYDDDGYVDIAKRGIRNNLDDYGN